MWIPSQNLRPELASGPEGPRTVLIVEDEALIAMQLEDIVASAGYRVAGIICDRAGIASCRVMADVALVDLNLRDGLTGPAIARELADQHDTAIVFVTANPEQIGDPPPTAAGFIHKPFTPASVLSAIAFALGNIPDPSFLPREVVVFPGRGA